MEQAKKKLHIGIILDGNRRYAEKNNINSKEGHRKGAEKVTELIKWCKEFGVRELTLYSFSVENFKRSEREKTSIFRLFKENIQKLKKGDKLEKEKIRVNFIGRLELFPEDLQREMHEVMKQTEDNDGYIINFAMAYGGRAEIIDAVRKIANKVKEGKVEPDEIDEKMINDNIYLSDEPDLVIRPGGEKRVSNFLIWQSYYSEWYFTDKLWPEFTKEDFKKAIEDLKQRERRFGK